MKIQTSIAFHKPLGTIKHVKDVANGLACECYCSDCASKLESVQSKNPPRKWYFRHYTKTNCKGSLESDLHKYAKQVILANNSLIGPNNNTIKFIKAIAEETIEQYRPDVIIDLENGEKIYIEIFVSNAVKEIKKNYFTSNKLTSFEIDLREIYGRNHLTDFDELDDLILKEFKNKKIIYWPELEVTKEDTNLIIQIIGAILFIAAFLRLGRLIQKDRNRYSIRKPYLYSRRKFGFYKTY